MSKSRTFFGDFTASAVRAVVHPWKFSWTSIPWIPSLALTLPGSHRLLDLLEWPLHWKLCAAQLTFCISLRLLAMFLSVSFSLCFHLPLHVSFAHLLLRQSQEMVDGTVQIFVSTIPKTGQKPWKEQGKNSKENCKKCNRLHSKNSCDQNIQIVGGLYTVHVSAWQLGPHLPGNWRSKGGPDRIICACWQKLSKSSPMAQAKAVCIRICRVYWWPCWCYSWSFLAHSKRYLSLRYSSIFFMTWFLHAVNLSLLACNESVNRNFVLHRGIGKIQLCLAAYKLVLVKPKRFSVNFACASSASPVQLDSLYTVWIQLLIAGLP